MKFEDIVHLLFSYFGRISRGKFWIGILILLALLAMEIVIAGVLSGPVDQFSPISSAIIFISILQQVYSQIALYVKRFHDLGHSGWVCLVFFFPLIGLGAFIYLAFFRGETGPNRYGSDPFGAPPTWSAAIFE